MPQNTMESLLRALRDDYLADLPTRLHEMENEVLALEDVNKYEEYYQTLFRNVHSIKGSAGTHGLFILTKICHRLEDHLTSKKNVDVITHSEASNLLNYIDLLELAREQIINGKEVFTKIESELDALAVVAFKDVIKVIIIGQSASTIDLITKLLINYSVQIVTASNGLQSLDKLMNDKFDLMFVGMELPVLNGIAVIAATRMSKSINATIPIVLFTSTVRIDVEPMLSVDYIIQRDSNMMMNVDEAFKTLFKNS